jgi:hypothetical protein
MSVEQLSWLVSAVLSAVLLRSVSVPHFPSFPWQRDAGRVGLFTARLVNIFCVCECPTRAPVFSYFCEYHPAF